MVSEEISYGKYNCYICHIVFDVPKGSSWNHPKIVAHRQEMSHRINAAEDSVQRCFNYAHEIEQQNNKVKHDLEELKAKHEHLVDLLLLGAHQKELHG